MCYRSLAVLEEGSEEMGTQYGAVGWTAGQAGPGTATVSASAYAAAAASVTALSQPATGDWTAVVV